MSQPKLHSVWLIFAIALLLALAAGCQSTDAEPTSGPAAASAPATAATLAADYALAATAWDLEYFGPADAPMAMLPETRASLIFFWDRYTGFDGCNWFLGTYWTSSNQGLNMMKPSSAPNICTPQALATQSGIFVSSLQNATHYAREAEQLIATTDEEQRLLTFKPAAPVPMPGTQWSLKFWWLADSEEWSPVIPESTTTISFGAGGEAAGAGGCNAYTVSYEGDLQVEKVLAGTDTYAALPTLSFGPVAPQKAVCTEPENIMNQEQEFFTALDSVAYYLKLGGILLLLDGEGVPLLMFAAQS